MCIYRDRGPVCASISFHPSSCETCKCIRNWVPMQKKWQDPDPDPDPYPDRMLGNGNKERRLKSKKDWSIIHYLTSSMSSSKVARFFLIIASKAGSRECPKDETTKWRARSSTVGWRRVGGSKKWKSKNLMEVQYHDDCTLLDIIRTRIDFKRGV